MRNLCKGGRPERLRLGLFGRSFDSDRGATLERLQLGLQFSPAGGGSPFAFFNQPLRAGAQPFLEFRA